MSQILLTRLDPAHSYHYSGFVKYLPVAKRESIAGYKFEKDKLLCIMGEVLLRYGLYHNYQISRNPKVIYGAYRKPYLAGEKIFFNISHSGEYVVCALDEHEIGVDIEQKTLTDKSLTELAAAFFSPYEYQELLKCDDKQDYFYQIWTLKESYLKYQGTGLYLEPNSFSFRLDKGEIGLFPGSADVDKKNLEFSQLKYIPHYSLSVCSWRKFSVTDIKVIDPEAIDRILQYEYEEKED